MKLGLQLGYWGAQPNPFSIALAQEAERLEFDSVWTAEAWGSDAFTPRGLDRRAHLAHPAVHRHRADLGAHAGVVTAMHALTLDHLSNGRFTLGLGVSGPQVVEGWYGQPFGKPLARTREYVEIVRRILRREEPVEFQGEHYRLPYDGPGSWGLGKPLRSITHPLRADLPILLGAEGPKNIELAAEIADGWMPLYYSPFRQDVYTESLAGRGGQARLRGVRQRHGLSHRARQRGRPSKRRSCRPRPRSRSTSAGWARATATSTWS